jgi:hypothetical protein
MRGHHRRRAAFAAERTPKALDGRWRLMFTIDSSGYLLRMPCHAVPVLKP